MAAVKTVVGTKIRRAETPLGVRFPPPAPSATGNLKVDNREFVYHANDSVLESAFEDARIHAQRGSSQGTHFLSH